MDDARLKRELVKSRKAVREKYQSLKNAEFETQARLEQTYKPLTQPLKQLISAVHVEIGESTPLQEESSDEALNLSDILERSKLAIQPIVSAPAYNEWLETFHELPRNYIDNNIKDKKHSFDHQFGIIHDIESDKFFLGLTRELLEIIVNPLGYKKEDLDNYMDILKRTNAYRRNYDPNEQVQGAKSSKYITIIAPYLQEKEKIVQKYNNTIHRTTGYKPNSVNNKNAEEILSNSYTHLKTVDPKRSKLKLNDFVRISKHREAFDKGYTPNWSSEIFQIQKVQLTNPTTYLLKDYKNEDVQGGFYKEELQKVKYPDVYLVEKILKQKGDKVYVKWLGFSNSINSWILKKDIL
ncbi:uncharacterized protein [Euwallacea fornicatus]|uniref:uncharacterized protein n=1 Tax=Euwallacea fornicatus TaxID=995702 RepID=UPI00338EE969